MKTLYISSQVKSIEIVMKYKFVDLILNLAYKRPNRIGQVRSYLTPIKILNDCI